MRGFMRFLRHRVQFKAGLVGCVEEPITEAEFACGPFSVFGWCDGSNSISLKVELGFGATCLQASLYREAMDNRYLEPIFDALVMWSDEYNKEK